MLDNNFMVAGLVLIVSFFVRVLAGRGVRQDHDSRAHLYYALRLKQSKGGPFSAISVEVATSSPFYNPFMWHWLVSLLPVKLVMRYQHLCNPLLDSFFCVFIYWIALRLGFSSEQAIIAVALYVFTPMWFSRLAMGPRTHSFTPRLSGEIATNVFFAVACLPLGLAEWLMGLLAIASCFFVLTSSKFGIQALLFLTPLICIFSWDVAPLGYLGAAVGFASLLSKGAFFNSLRKQMEHLTWFFLKNLKGDMHVSNRNKLGPEYARKEQEQYPFYLLRVFKRLCTRNSFAGVGLKLPVLLFVLLGLMWPEYEWNSSFFLVPVLAATAVYFLINIPQLLFLGEAERYLNHVAIFIVLSALHLSTELGWLALLSGIVAYGIAFLLGEGLVIPQVNSGVAERKKDADKVMTYLKQTPETVVLGFPFHACDGFYRVMTDTHHKTLFIGGTISIAKQYADRFSSSYPFVKLDKLEEMRVDLGVTVLILNNLQRDKLLGPDWRAPASWEAVDVGCTLNTLYVYK